MYFRLSVPKVTEITLPLLYIRIEYAENYEIKAEQTTMDPRLNLLRNGIITIIVSLALGFGLALLSG